MLNIPRKFEVLLPFFTLLVGIIFLFPEVFLKNHVLVPWDNFYQDPVFKESAPPGFAQSNNSWSSDHNQQLFVWHTIASKYEQTVGRVPLWNPYLLAGQPLVANGQPGLYYPPNLLLFLFSAGYVATLRALMNILIGGMFTFLFARELRIGIYGAWLASISFAFSVAILWGPGHAAVSSFVWLPMMMWAGAKILSGSKAAFWSGLAGLALGMSFLGGHPETTFGNLLLFTLYFGGRIISSSKTKRLKMRMVSYYLLAIWIGFLIGSIQWIPTANFIRQSNLTSRSRSTFDQAVNPGQSFFYSEEWIKNLGYLSALIMPNFFGNPTDETYLNMTELAKFYPIIFFGFIPFILACGAGYKSILDKSENRWLTAAALFLLALVVRFPGVEIINNFPIFNSVNTDWFRLHFCFLGAILSGIGLDYWRASFNSQQKADLHFRRLMILITSVVVFFLVAVSIHKWFIIPSKGIALSGIVDEWFTYILTPQQPRTIISLVIIPLTLIILWIVHKKNQFAHSSLIVFIALTFIELLIVSRGFNTTVPNQVLIPEIRLSKRLAKDNDLFRILSIPPTFWPNVGALYGHYDLGGYDLPIYRWYMQIYAAQGGNGYRQMWQPDWPLVDYMNVKYIISPWPLSQENLEPFMTRDGFYVYLNKSSLPRAMMVFNSVIETDQESALEKLTSGKFDFRNSVLFEDPLPLEQNPTFLEKKVKNKTGPASVIEWKRFENDDLELEIQTKYSGFLVLSEVYAPGWKAFLDGKETNVYRANHAFRSVYIPSGTHHLSLSYQPLDSKIGTGLTIVGLLVFGIITVRQFGVSLRRRSQFNLIKSNL